MTQPAIFIVLISLLFSCVTADSSKDTEECAPQLAGLATCLPYVGGQAKAPTPDCCNGLKQVLKNDKKCLCVIIKDRNDPNLGLNINASLAMGLPSVCHATANVSKCPELLHLDPKSPEAKIFYQFGKDSSHGGTSPASAPVSGGAASTGVAENPASAKSLGTGSSAQMKSKSCSGKRSMWSEFVTVGILLLLY